MRITGCRVNHLENPLGYLLESLSFSWVVEDALGKKQACARLVISERETVCYDSGYDDLNSLATRVELTLKPYTRYTWTITVRSDAGEEAASDVNWFETGKMDETWQANWIGCDDSEPRHPVFFKPITPTKPVASARLYICGLGLYEAAWNGEKIGDEYLTPYCNNYNAFLQYQTYDVTAQMQMEGLLSITLGNGWYKGRFGFAERTGKGYFGNEWLLIAEVRLLYNDGTSEVICTDESWQVARSRITFSNIYDGEHRDDTLADVAPLPAVRKAAPKGKLTARLSLPVRVQQTLPVREIIRTPKDELVLDIGQNMTGSFHLRVHEPKGTTIRVRFGEILQQGCFYRDNLRTAKAEYVYVSDGEPHVLEPRFTFYGYRYVCLEGMSHFAAEDFTALVLHSDLPRTGYLTTGNGKVNQLVANAEWGHIGNFLDVPTDCPQRDERMGWTGDAQVFAPTACYQRDSYAFFAKYLYDVYTEQQMHDGTVPVVVPAVGNDGCSTAWGDAACIIPMVLYDYYGDIAILEAQYDSMVAWVEFLKRTDGEDDGWRRHFHFGDWLALDVPSHGVDERAGGTDKGLIASTYFRFSTLLLARAAALLGKPEDEKKYTALADRLLLRIRDEYFTPNGRCAIPTQTALLLTLRHGLSIDRERTMRDLIEKMEQSDGMLQTGFVGTPLLCATLTDIGMTDMAFDLLLNEEYPGWLYAVNLGATTIWERWNSVLPDGSISGTGMNSLNHYSYGCIVEWLYRDVAGITPEAPGFRHARLAPHIDARLGEVRAVYQSAAGTWESAWKTLESGEITYRCLVPFGCTASASLPYGGGQHVLEAGEHRFTWMPDTPVRVTYHTGMPIRELLGRRRVRKVLEEQLPQVQQLPISMHHISLRVLAKQMGGKLSDETLAQLDTELSKL